MYMQKQNHLEVSGDYPENQQLQNRPYRAADMILNYLEQLGVEYMFGIPGGGIEPLYDALARSQRLGGIRPIVARHESGAAFMADGYARESGKLGVCCATTGPGATNMITGVASAYMDHTPLLAITAQTSLTAFGRGAAQESSCTGIDTVAMYKHCTRYNTLVSHPDQLERKLIAAITTAMQPPFGPAHISVPIDILRGPITNYHAVDLKKLTIPSNGIDDGDINNLYRKLVNAQHPIFVVGAGAGQSLSPILELATLINAQVITTSEATGIVNSFHPQYRGVYGISGHSTAHSLLKSQNVDVVLAIGVNLDEFTTNGWEATTLFSEKSLFIDSTPLNFYRSPMSTNHISGNIRRIFEYLLARFIRIHKQDRNNAHRQLFPESVPKNFSALPFERRAGNRRHHRSASSFSGISYLHTIERRQESDRRKNLSSPPLALRFNLKDKEKYLSEQIPIKPQRLMYDLSRLFPPTTRFLADNGNSTFWAIHYLHPTPDKHITNISSIRLGMGFLSMGWAIGAAVGTALAVPDTPVVCITGDGSLLMSGQELTVALQQNLSVIFVILNDSALGTVKHGQKLGGRESVGYELPVINFAGYAKAMGVEGHIITSPQDMVNLDIISLCKKAGPTLLDIRIDPFEIPPIEERVKMLRTEIAY